MSATSSTPGTHRPGMAAGIAMRIGTIFAVLILQGVILFGGAGRLDWPWAWVYFAISLAVLVINAPIALRTSPETIAERGRPGKMPGWDKAVSSIWTTAMYLALPLVAALDARFGWTASLAVAWHVAGAIALAAGYGVAAWAMLSNAYFSTVVRIQSERGHTVCRSGPYRFVRHPGYVGYTLQALAMPFLLGSLWALLPALAGAIPMVIRTALEDRTLQAELPGYREYARDVRYRLIPGVW